MSWGKWPDEDRERIMRGAEQHSSMYAGGGDFIPIVFAVLFVACLLFAILYPGCAESSNAQETDFEAEVTTVRVRMAGASYGPYTAWKNYELHGYDDVNLSLQLPSHWGSYRWVIYRSGPQACAFTAVDADHRPHTHRLTNIGGGRTIDADNNSAYFQPWPADVWIAQGPCSEHGIPECSGICR